MIKAPRLLDNGLNEIRRINPTSISLTLNLTPLSTATMKLPAGEKVPERSWVEIYSPTGSVGIFRAREPINGYGDNETSIELEHAVTEVGDWIVEEEIQATKTVTEAITQFFTHYGGNKWQLGSFSFADSVTVDLDHDNLLESILGVVKQTPYMLTFDFSTTPWTLGLAQVGQSVTAEGRLSRNVLSATIQKNDSDLCTRIFYCYQEKQNKQQVDVWGHYDADTISTYGVVEKKLSETQLTQAEAETKAAEYLAIHKHPKLSVTINGYDLSSITGETLDSLVLGKKYRLTIPDEGVVVEEIVKTLQYSDLVDKEYDVTVSLAQEDDYLIDALNNTKALSKASSSTKKKLSQIEYEFEDEDGRFASYLFMNYERLRLSFEDSMCGLRSDLELTAQHLQTTFTDDINSLRGTVEQTASYWRSTYEDGMNGLRGEIEQTASYWRSTYENSFNSLRTIVEQTDSGWRTALSGVVDANGRVTAASIATKINAQGQAGVAISGAWISIGEGGGSTIKLNDKLTIDTNGNLILNGNVYGGLSGQYYFQGTNYKIVGSSSSQGAEVFELNANNVRDMIIKASVSGNTLTLWKMGADTSATSGNGIINFSKAVASVEWSWSNGTLTVTPKPQNDNFVLGSLVVGSKSFSNGTYTVPVRFEWGSSGQYSEVVRNITVTPSVTAGTSSMTWDSTNRVLYNYGYAYIEGGSQAVATSTKRSSSTISLDTSSSWSNGNKSIYVKHGSSNILSDTVSIPASSGTTWENPTGHQWRARLTVGGAYRYSDNHEFYTLSEYNTALATVPSGYTAKSATYITNGSINAASIAVYSGHYACNMSLTLNFGDGTTATADVSGGVIVDDIVEYGKSIGGGGEAHTTSYSMYCTEGGQVPGQSTYRYRFTIEFSSPRNFSAGSSYTFWR